MANSMKRKSAIVSEKIDRISNLPDDVTGKILEALPIFDAARTSVLSRRWRYLWTTHMHVLSIDHSFSFKCWPLFDIAPVFHQIFLSHKVPFRKFELDITRYCPGRLCMDQWLLHLLISSPKLEEITLNNMGYSQDYKLHSCFFLFKMLQDVKLGGVVFRETPLCGNFGNGLISLSFHKVCFKGSIFLRTPLLESLRFKLCVGVEKVKVDAPKLQRLCFDDLRNIESLEQGLDHLEWLCLWGKWEKQFGYKSIVSLLHVCPKLKKLEIKVPANFNDFNLEILDVNNENKFEVLQSVRIKYFHGSRAQKSFTRFLLSSCPSLEKMVIHLNMENLEEKQMSEVTKEIMNFNCASAAAEILIYPPVNFKRVKYHGKGAYMIIYLLCFTLVKFACPFLAYLFA